jgi:hypothetical protein
MTKNDEFETEPDGFGFEDCEVAVGVTPGKFVGVLITV